MRALICILSLNLLSSVAHAEEKKEPPAKPELPVARIIAPLLIPIGSDLPIQLRGDHLDKAIKMILELDGETFEFDPTDKKADLGEIKGFDNKEIGSTMCMAKCSIPANWIGKAFNVRIMTEGGQTEPMTCRVAGEKEIPEKEPNQGFKDAQPIKVSQSVFGEINNEKDVDVFSISLKAGQKIRISVMTNTRTNLLDPFVTIFDHNGSQVAGQDDSGLDRDPNFVFSPPVEANWFVVLQDAHRLGSEWHAYTLKVSETSK